MRPKINYPLLNFVVLGGCIGLLPLLTGCDSVTSGSKIESRVKEMPELFAQLPVEAQETIRWGYVKKGYNPAMVYMAFGEPDKTEVSEDKTRITWIYDDDTILSQEVSMRTGAAENGSAYHSSSGQSGFGGEAITMAQIDQNNGSRGAAGSGLTNDGTGKITAKALVIFERGKVKTVRRVESPPREKTFENHLNFFEVDSIIYMPEGDVRLGEATEVSEEKKDE